MLAWCKNVYLDEYFLYKISLKLKYLFIFVETIKMVCDYGTYMD